ncbi:hypothetical protein [Streptomyces sp. NRRL B-24484]|uniref:hypothetical protein n=1 Tax=Streptomyces sp. NRRL B-24484 TaxID=1463833 RepID=UPI0006933548|nr:hypothetical protein [Streptomyces sp. NRRL B-24484]
MDDEDRGPFLGPLDQEPVQALTLLAGLAPGCVLRPPGDTPPTVVRHLVEGTLLYLRVRFPGGIPVCPDRLTYQAQRIDPEGHAGWLVLVTGSVRLVPEPDERDRPRIPVGPWSGEVDQLLLLVPERLSVFRLAGAPG